MTTQKLPHDDKALDDLSEFFADIDVAVPQAPQRTKGVKQYVKNDRFKEDVFVEKVLQGKAITDINREMGRHPTSGPPRNEYYKQRLATRQANLASKMEITAERILREMAKIAFIDPRAFYNEDGTPVPVHMLDDDAAASLAAIEVHKLGKDQDWAEVVKYRHHDKLKALDQLGKSFNIYAADNERKVDVNIKEVSDTERARRVAFVLQEAVRAQEPK